MFWRNESQPRLCVHEPAWTTDSSTGKIPCTTQFIGDLVHYNKEAHRKFFQSAIRPNSPEVSAESSSRLAIAIPPTKNQRIKESENHVHHVHHVHVKELFHSVSAFVLRLLPPRTCKPIPHSSLCLYEYKYKYKYKYPYYHATSTHRYYYY